MQLSCPPSVVAFAPRPAPLLRAPHDSGALTSRQTERGCALRLRRPRMPGCGWYVIIAAACALLLMVRVPERAHRCYGAHAPINRSQAVLLPHRADAWGAASGNGSSRRAGGGQRVSKLASPGGDRAASRGGRHGTAGKDDVFWPHSGVGPRPPRAPPHFAPPAVPPRPTLRAPAPVAAAQPTASAAPLPARASADAPIPLAAFPDLERVQSAGASDAR
jgi:hypothetical protein